MDQVSQPHAHDNWFSTLLLGCAAAAVLHVIWTIIHDIYFHPLSGFPGPIICKVSRVPYWIASFRGRQIYFMKGLHDKYGSAIRFSPDELSYTDPQAWKDICGHQKGRLENPKAPGFQYVSFWPDIPWDDLKMQAIDLSSSLETQNGKDGTLPSMMVADTADHVRVRRLFSPAFSDRALKQQQPLFSRYAELLISKLLAVDGQPVDMTIMFNLTTFDIMAEFAFGESLGLLENSRYTSWLQNVISTVKAVPLLQFINYYPLLHRCFDLLEPRAVRESRKNNFRHAADRVDKRLEKGSGEIGSIQLTAAGDALVADQKLCIENKKDKFDLWNLLDSTEGGEHLSLGEMHANSMVFMVAGTETTATLLTALTYLLLVNPESFELVKREIRAQAATAVGLSFEKLASLKYMNACLQEALRLFPPVPVGIPRAIASNSSGGQTVCGKWLPSGTQLSVHQYAAYRSLANFKDPDHFVPERWLDDARYMGDHRDVCQPFSYGPRNCLGQNMAWYEMRIVFATLIANFDIELCEESRDWMPGRVFMLWEKKPMMVRLRRVEV